MSTISNVQVGIQNAAGTLAHTYTVLTFSNGSTQTLAAGPNSSNQLTSQTYSTPNYNQASQQASQSNGWQGWATWDVTPPPGVSMNDFGQALLVDSQNFNAQTAAGSTTQYVGLDGLSVCNTYTFNLLNASGLDSGTVASMMSALEQVSGLQAVGDGYNSTVNALLTTPDGKPLSPNPQPNAPPGGDAMAQQNVQAQGYSLTSYEIAIGMGPDGTTTTTGGGGFYGGSGDPVIDFTPPGGSGVGG